MEIGDMKKGFRSAEFNRRIETAPPHPCTLKTSRVPTGYALRASTGYTRRAPTGYALRAPTGYALRAPTGYALRACFATPPQKRE